MERGRILLKKLVVMKERINVCLTQSTQKELKIISSSFFLYLTINSLKEKE